MRASHILFGVAKDAAPAAKAATKTEAEGVLKEAKPYIAMFPKDDAA